MKDMTRANLMSALAGESQAHIKYMVFAQIAEREKLPNIARLFRAAAMSEEIHAANHLKALGLVGTTPANLQAAFGGEDFEIAEMYPAYIEVAKLQDEKRAVSTMSDAMETEKVHRALYERAQAAVSTDLTLPAVHVCQVCGYTMEGDAPERCPICGAVHTRFTTF